MSTSFASLNATLLARKGEAKPSQEPRFGHMPWSPPKPAPQPTAVASVGNPENVAELKVRIDQVTSVWPAQKPSRSDEESVWVPNKAIPPLDGSTHPVKTTIRLTHAQARAVRLAALVLDKPQQEILTHSLLAQLEALACTDLASCSCFRAVVAGLADAKEPDLLVGATSEVA
jgi:hypothetical protein